MKIKFMPFVGKKNGVTIITGSGDIIAEPLTVDIKQHFAAHLIDPVLFVKAVASLQTTSNFLVLDTFFFLLNLNIG